MEQQDNAGTHIYFIAYDKASGHPIGAVRIYDQQSEHNSVSIGSWVMLDHTPSTLSLETLALAVYYIDFLGFPLCHFAVHPGNRSVLRFHQKLGASIQDAQADSIALINDPKVFLQRLGAHYKLALSSPSILV
jgi:RimJ/RimL family protein N-acetyltransferase